MDDGPDQLVMQGLVKIFKLGISERKMMLLV